MSPGDIEKRARFFAEMHTNRTGAISVMPGHVEGFVTGLAALITQVDREAREECAKIADNIYGKKYPLASEIPGRYRVQDETVGLIVAKIRSTLPES